MARVPVSASGLVPEVKGWYKGRAPSGDIVPIVIKKVEWEEDLAVGSGTVPVYTVEADFHMDEGTVTLFVPEEGILRTETAALAERPDLSKGGAVFITGLDTVFFHTQCANGEKGKLVGWAENVQRWSVAMDVSGAILSLRPKYIASDATGTWKQYAERAAREQEYSKAAIEREKGTP